jgi:ferredoxin
MVRQVAIVGSGASALATVKTLLELNSDLEITVLDIAGDEESTTSIGLKSYFGSTSVYDRNKSKIEHVNLKPVVWPSSGLGGFSRIWGAAIGENASNNFNTNLRFGKNGDASPFATESAAPIRKKYAQTINPRWRLLDHYIAVNPKSCISCGECLTGCPTNAIWFAGDEWHKLPMVKMQKNFRVQKLFISDNKVIISSVLGKTFTADWVFLAAGALASTQILMSSGLIPNQVSIKDTDTLFFPALRFPVKEGKKSFALSQISANLSREGELKSYIQLYPDSRNLSESLIRHRAFLGRILAKNWKILSPFIATGILYIDAESSSGLDLTMTPSGAFKLSRTREKNQIRRFIRIHRIGKSIFKEFGLLPLFFLGKKGEPGESFHFGAVSDVVNFNSRSDSFPVKVVDSSALLSLEPGPITDKVMNNASSITRKFVGEANEISH